MPSKLLPAAILSCLIAGCAQLPHIAPVAADNPANSAANGGGPISERDFLNIRAAVRESAPVAVTAGAGLPGAPRTVHHGSGASESGADSAMPGMKMNMNMTQVTGDSQ